MDPAREAAKKLLLRIDLPLLIDFEVHSGIGGRSIALGELLAYDGHVPWCVDAQANRSGTETNDSDRNFVTDSNALVDFSRENQHGVRPCL
jgi:hypothetical protein